MAVLVGDEEESLESNVSDLVKKLRTVYVVVTVRNDERDIIPCIKVKGSFDTKKEAIAFISQMDGFTRGDVYIWERYDK